MKKVCSGCGKEKDMLSWETLCYACQNKRNDERIKEQITSGEIDNVECESDIFCPYCGEKIETDCDDPVCYEEGYHDYECPYCEKKFKVDTAISVYYSTSRIEDDG